MSTIYAPVVHDLFSGSFPALRPAAADVDRPRLMRRMRGSAFRESNVMPYVHRPFDTRWLYVDSNADREYLRATCLSELNAHPEDLIAEQDTLLEGDAGALSLLRSNHFPDNPPRFVLAQFYEYHLTTPTERRESGRWWNRRLVGSYFPPVSLRAVAP